MNQEKNNQNDRFSITKCEANLGQKLSCRVELAIFGTRDPGDVTALDISDALVLRRSAEALASQSLVVSHDRLGSFLIDDDSVLKKSMIASSTSLLISIENARHLIIVGVTEIVDVLYVGELVFKRVEKKIPENYS